MSGKPGLSSSPTSASSPALPASARGTSVSKRTTARKAAPLPSVVAGLDDLEGDEPSEVVAKAKPASVLGEPRRVDTATSVVVELDSHLPRSPLRLGALTAQVAAAVLALVGTSYGLSRAGVFESGPPSHSAASPVTIAAERSSSQTTQVLALAPSAAEAAPADAKKEEASAEAAAASPAAGEPAPAEPAEAASASAGQEQEKTQAAEAPAAAEPASSEAASSEAASPEVASSEAASAESSGAAPSGSAAEEPAAEEPAADDAAESAASDDKAASGKESVAERRAKRAARRAAAIEARRARRAGAQKPAEKEAAAPPAAEEAASSASASSGPASSGPEPGSNFDRQAAQTALTAAADKAKNCRPIGGPSGAGTVQVQYEPSGKVSAVTIVTPGFENTDAGSCIQMLFRRARVPQFNGTKPVTLRQRFEIP